MKTNSFLVAVGILLALALNISFAQEAQEKSTRFGIRAGFNVNDPYGKEAKELEIGLGGGGGIVMSFPITSVLRLNEELNFSYRRLFSQSSSDGSGDDKIKYYSYESELVLSLPIMLQFAPSHSGFKLHDGDGGAHFVAGVQLDFPFSPKTTQEAQYENGHTESVIKEFKERADVDFGIVLGIGCIFSNFGIDLRSVIGLTSIVHDNYFKASFNQYGLGVTYLFY